MKFVTLFGVSVLYSRTLISPTDVWKRTIVAWEAFTENHAATSVMAVNRRGAKATPAARDNAITTAATCRRRIEKFVICSVRETCRLGQTAEMPTLFQPTRIPQNCPINPSRTTGAFDKMWPFRPSSALHSRVDSASSQQGRT